jgi:hypothetical protein
MSLLTIVRVVAVSQWRARRQGLVVLMLLAMGVGVLVAGAFSAASRAGSVLDRALADAAASDVIVGGPPEIVARIVALDEVEVAAPIVTVAGRVDGVDEPLVTYSDPTGTWLARVDRPRVVDGDLPDWNDPDQILATEPTAEALGLRVGDEVRLRPFTDHEGTQLGSARELVVVGISRDLDDAVAPSPGRFYATPAFARALQSGAVDQYSVRLRPGADIELFEVHARAIAPDAEVAVIERVGELRRLSDALNVFRNGIVVFALSTAVAGILAIVLVVDRQVRLAGDTVERMHTIGMTRRQCVVCIAGGLVPIATIAGLGAAILAVVTSPIASVGLAGRLDPDRGINVDGFVVALVALSVAGVVLSAGAWSAWRWARPARGLVTSSSRVAKAIGRLGASVAVVTGVRLALERKRGVDRLRPGLAAAVLGVAGVAGAAVVGASLDRLVDTPTRYGWTWDASIDHLAPQRSDLLLDLGSRSDIDAFGHVLRGTVVVSDRDIPAIAVEPVAGDLSLALIDGRPPMAPDEVVVGSETAARFGVEIGDLFKGPGLRGRTFRVVGNAVFPSVGFDVIGDGAWFDRRGFDAVVGDAEETLVLRWAEGVDEAAAAARLEEALGAVAVFEIPGRPLEVANVARSSWVPWLVATTTAVFALVALIHMLVVTASRRQRDLGVLRALGFLTRQVSRVVLTEAVAIVVVGLVVGLPLGALVGTRVWRSVANGLGVADDPVLPLLTFVAIAVVAPIAAVAAALAPGRRATRRPPAAVLSTT